MDEKKGLLTALAETLKQYEMIQTDDKESQAIALEEKLDEIAKMISSLSDRVDSLSSRLTSIGDKVDAMAAASEKEPEGGLFDNGFRVFHIIRVIDRGKAAAAFLSGPYMGGQFRLAAV